MSESAATPPAPRRRRRWPWVLLGLAVLLWFLPVIIAKTPLFNWLVQRAVGPLNGKLVIGRASLGWLSPVRIEAVQLQDANGVIILEVGQVETSRRLWDFLWNRQDLGTIHIKHARGTIAVDAGSTNLEKTLAPLIARVQEAPASAGSTRLQIEVSDLSLTLSAGTDSATVGPLDVTLSLNAKPDIPLELTATLAASADGRLSVHLVQDISSAPVWTAKVETTSFNLAPLNPILARLGQPIRGGGVLSGSASCQVSASPSLSAQIDSTVKLEKAWLEAPGLKDRLALNLLDLTCRAQQRASRLTVQAARLSCDVGTAEGQGAFDLQGALTDLLRRDLDLNLDIDLAKLAQRLPKTLSLHEDLELTSGRCQVTLKSTTERAETRWSGSLSTRDLEGRRGGRAVALAEPIRADLQLRVGKDGVPLLDRLQCASEFLSLSGTGSGKQLRLTGDADLGRLSTLLAQFVDLGGARFQGQAKFTAEGRALVNDHYQALLDAQINGWHIEWSGAPWKEDAAALKLDGLLKNGKDHWSLIGGKVTWESGADHAHALLLAPINDPAFRNLGKWDVVLSGDLARWQRRLELATGPWIGWRLSGGGELKALLSPEKDLLKIDNIFLTTKDLRLLGPGLWLQEPSLTLEGHGRLTASRLLCKQLRLRCGSVNADAADVSIDWASHLEVAGGFSLAADIARLRRWTLDPSGPAPDPVAGTATGQLSLRWQARRTAFDANLTLNNFIWGPPKSPAFQDPRIRLQAKGAWETEQDLCRLDLLHLESQFLTGAAKGKLTNLNRAATIELTGDLSYDLQKLTPLLKPYLGAGAVAEGKGTRPFALTGPLAESAALGAKKEKAIALLKGEAGLHWDKVEAYRCQIGAADIKATLDKGQLRLTPIHTTLNEGKLHLDAGLRLLPGPAEVFAPRGLVIERARITPAMCNDALGYALPALAGVSEVEGLMSFELDHAHMPLEDPSRADVKGTLTLHDVRVGPTPLLREISLLFKGPAPARIKKEARIPIYLASGKVHHQNLELIFSDFAIATSGWVGLDGTLGLLVDLPVQSSWVGGDRIGKALEGRVIRVPLTGTLSSPKLDQRAFQNTLAQLVRDVTGSVIRNELEERLKKLLTPKGK